MDKQKGLLEVIEKRRAYRGISDKPLQADVIQRLLTAATYAPSCFNKQPWRFLAAVKEEALDKVRGALAGGNYWAQKAPFYVVAVTRPDLDCQLNDGRDYALFDVGQAVMSLQHQAVHEGLIAHPIAGFSPDKLKASFGIPDDYIVITVVIIAHPGNDEGLNEKHKALEHSERTRAPQNETVAFDNWNFAT